MEVQVGMCGLMIAFFSTVFGLVEVGLWLTCYFECTTGKEIAFNYFAAIWTGALAFASGFMISVLFCVKFRFLGSFIIIVTCVLVPCEIFCACIYGYRAYESREHLDLDVPLFVSMAVVGAILFVITIMWNCYYCCIATPQDDYDEQIKEELEEEENRQVTIRNMQNRFTNNPIVDDEYRNGRPAPVLFAQPVTNQYPEVRPLQEAQQNRYPQENPPRTSRDDRQPNSVHPQGGHRHVNRPANYPQSMPVRDDYPYPPAFVRERAPEQQSRRQPENILSMPRANFSQSQHDADIGRGQVNRGYEPDAFGRPIDESYSLRSYIFDGMQGQEYSQQSQQSWYPESTPPPEYYSESSRRQPGQYGANSYQDAERGRQRNERNGSRDTNRYGQGSSSRDTGQREDNRSYIYRPRPENFRGKPPKPSYMQQERAAARSNGNIGVDSAHFSAFRGSRTVDAYF